MYDPYLRPPQTSSSAHELTGLDDPSLYVQPGPEKAVDTTFPVGDRVFQVTGFGSGLHRGKLILRENNWDLRIKDVGRFSFEYTLTDMRIIPTSESSSRVRYVHHGLPIEFDLSDTPSQTIIQAFSARLRAIALRRIKPPPDPRYLLWRNRLIFLCLVIVTLLIAMDYAHFGLFAGH